MAAADTGHLEAAATSLGSDWDRCCCYTWWAVAAPTSVEGIRVKMRVVWMQQPAAMLALLRQAVVLEQARIIAVKSYKARAAGVFRRDWKVRRKVVEWAAEGGDVVLHGRAGGQQQARDSRGML